FFISSRRRHTRFSRDWSSDVCSSDLALNLTGEPSLAKFDDAAEIYATLLTLLEENAEYFELGDVESTALAAFKKQDILFQGSLEIGRASCRKECKSR